MNGANQNAGEDWEQEERGRKERTQLLIKYTIVTETDTGKIIVNCPRLGKLIINEFDHHFLTIDDATRQMFHYNGGCYQSNAENVILGHIEWLLDDLCTTHRKNESVGFIRDRGFVKRDIFNADPHLINVNNGVFNIKTGKLAAHSPDYYFLNKIPVNYDKKASSKDFEQWLQHICMQQGKRRIHIENTIQEYMGYSLYRAYPFKVYAVLDGSGDNAKTTLLDILLSVIGVDNNTSISLQDLNDRPFAKHKLHGKLTNVSDDLPKRGLKYSGAIKQITGNSPLWADIKNHPEGINFTNVAKPWYACNELPETPDITDAFFCRMLQITLLNKYVRKADWDKVDNISVFKANTDIVKKFSTPKQLSGILNFMLKGLNRVLKNKRFSDQETTEEKRETWLKKTNPIHAFIDAEIEIGDIDWCITVDDFADEVISYCDRMGFDRPTRKKITTKINQEGAGIRKQQRIINSVPRTWCWVGIKSTTNGLVNHFLGTDQAKKEQETIV